MIINYVVEGPSDSGLAEALITASGHSVGSSYIKRGKSRLDPDIPRYLRAAMYGPDVAWLILRDSDNECPVQLRRSLPRQEGDRVDEPANFLLRIVHTMSEGWLLSDIENAASFFRIPAKMLPSDSEEIVHPKQRLLQLCKIHSPAAFRKRFVRPDGSPGPEFTSLINEFAREHWDIGQAAVSTPSLRRTLLRLSQLP